MDDRTAYDPATGLNSLGLPGRPEDTRVVVAMSGGVDSSVTAGLLARQGYEVVGMTLQLYDHGAAIQKKGACCAGQDIHDARRVAETLGIAHYVLDYEDRFRSSVIDAFANSYIAGETPIPCVLCNQTVKFRDLLGTARDLGAACLATGHYITTRPDPDMPGRRRLYRALDETRDQSYFLFATTQEQLDFLRFPLGEIPKEETRRMAAELGLGVAAKPDSQDICFVPTGRYTSVIERLRPQAGDPGPIVHLDGRELGRHDGIVNFTVGQRRGLGVATGEPLFVVRLDKETATVVVGPREALYTRDMRLRDINWLGDATVEEAAADGLDFFVKVRSTRPPQAARLKLLDGGVVGVRLGEGEFGISPGQACVFYESDAPGARVLGGGWIDEARPESDGVSAAGATVAGVRAPEPTTA